MTDVIATLKIMPTSPDVDLEGVKDKANEMITEFGGELGKVEIEPIAFGIKALKLIIVFDEEKGSTDALEEKIGGLEGVESVECTDIRRAIG